MNHPADAKALISVVVQLFNEEANLPKLYRRLIESLERMGIVGQYLRRIFLETKGRPTYIIGALRQKTLGGISAAQTTHGMLQGPHRGLANTLSATFPAVSQRSAPPQGGAA